MFEEALECIKASDDGILQCDLWKILDIDSRKCSSIVIKLMNEQLITREPESVKGARTYRLRCTEVPDSDRFKSLLADNIFEPCAGCISECVPEHCPELSEWIFTIIASGSADLDHSIKKVPTGILP